MYDDKEYAFKSIITVTLLQSFLPYCVSNLTEGKKARGANTLSGDIQVISTAIREQVLILNGCSVYGTNSFS